MTTSLPKLKRSATPARTSRPANRADYGLSTERNRASSSEAKSFLSAVGLGMRESVQEIVRSRRCDFLVKDPRGFNCVHLAVKKDDVRLLELLCEHCKVPPGLPIRDDLKATAIHRAAKAGSLNALKYLIEKARVNPHSKDLLGRNALFYAVKKGHLEVVVYLVGSAKVSAKGVQRNNGDTLLHVATREGFAQLAVWLVEKAGLDPHVFNNMSRNALHLAVKRNSLDLVRYFHARREVNPYLPDNKNMTALGYSALTVTRLAIFTYFLGALGVTAIVFGDLSLTRSLWQPPPTAFEVAQRQYNSSALKLVEKARKTLAKVEVAWVNAIRWKLPRDVVRTLGRYLG